MAFCSEIKNSCAASSFASPKQDALEDAVASGGEPIVCAAAQGAFEQLLSAPPISPSLQGRVRAVEGPDRPKISLKKVLGLDFAADIAMKVLFKRWQLEDLSLLSLFGLDLYDKAERLSHPSLDVQNKLNLHRQGYSAVFMNLYEVCRECTEDISRNIPQLTDLTSFLFSIESLKIAKSNASKFTEINQLEMNMIIKTVDMFICVLEYERNFYSETGQFYLLDKQVSDFEEGCSAMPPSIENGEKAYNQLRTYMNYCASMVNHSSINWGGFLKIGTIAKDFLPELASFAQESIATLRGSIHLLRTTLILTANRFEDDLKEAQEGTLNYEDWCVKYPQLRIQELSHEEFIGFLLARRWESRLVDALLLPVVSTLDFRIALPPISKNLSLIPHMDRFIEKISGYKDVFSEAKEGLFSSDERYAANPLIKKVEADLCAIMDLIEKDYEPLFELASQPNLETWLNQLNIRRNYRDIPFWIRNLTDTGSFDNNLSAIEDAHSILVDKGMKLFSQLESGEILEEDAFRLFSKDPIEETISVVQAMYSVVNRCLIDTIALSRDMRAIAFGECDGDDLEALLQSLNRVSDSTCDMIRSLHRRHATTPLSTIAESTVGQNNSEHVQLIVALTAEEFSSDAKDSEEIEEASPSPTMTPPQHALDRQINTAAKISRVKKPSKPRRQKAPLDSRQLKKELRARGFRLERQGPHQIFINPEGQIISVPRRGEQKRGTTLKIIKMISPWMA